MVNPAAYFSEVIRELHKVTWPSKDQTINKTLLVIGVSLILAAFLGGLDYLFQQLVTGLI
jgi:preprotein translocase subunit SecE